jgi:hypothetical protein
MIDSSRSPRPFWSRAATAILLAGAIAIAAWFVWVKELHHHNIHVRTFVKPAVAALVQSVPGATSVLV